ncbi:hypothetical protein ABIC78_000524 [Novosphingobium sp. 1529]|uniref:hypothetical protein n=1 Tax=Novosphingobium sp. 1529 TaxID=3156424 RepID=UPI0033982E91
MPPDSPAAPPKGGREDAVGDGSNTGFGVAVARMRDALERSRSDKLLALFDHLAARARDAAAPSEAQIAAEVFADGRSAAHRPDANVRVYVHRLRRLIETEFAHEPGPRLHLPVGTYRLMLVDAAMPAQHQGAITAQPPVVLPGTGPTRPWVIALVAVLAVVALVLGSALVVRWQRGAGDRLDGTAPWSALAGASRPITVVMGDYYFFAETPASGMPARLVWDRAVPTREDLIIFQMLNPQTASAVTDRDQHYVTSATMTAAATIRAALLRDPAFAQRPIRLIAASQLTPDVLKVSDVVYVGQLSGIGALLRDPLAQASGFRLDAGLDSLVDAQGGKPYHSDGLELRDQRIARRDYGYLACLPGPAGNTVLVIAALRDPGLREMADLATDTGRLRGLRHGRIGCGGGFEALFQVRTLGNANLGASLVVDRPTRSQGIWDNAAPAPEYHPIAATTAPVH